MCVTFEGFDPKLIGQFWDLDARREGQRSEMNIFLEYMHRRTEQNTRTLHSITYVCVFFVYAYVYMHVGLYSMYTCKSYG